MINLFWKGLNFLQNVDIVLLAPSPYDDLTSFLLRGRGFEKVAIEIMSCRIRLTQRKLNTLDSLFEFLRFFGFDLIFAIFNCVSIYRIVARAFDTRIILFD